jgi:hypothetical protein
VTGSREAVQEKNGRLLRIAGFAVENLEPINGDGFEGEFGCIHDGGGSSS